MPTQVDTCKKMIPVDAADPDLLCYEVLEETYTESEYINTVDWLNFITIVSIF